MTLMRQLGRNVQRTRQARGWTQATLAQRVGTSRIYLAQIEGGFAKTCSLRMLERVARALRVSPARLLGCPRRARTPAAEEAVTR